MTLSPRKAKLDADKRIHKQITRRSSTPKRVPLRLSAAKRVAAPGGFTKAKVAHVGFARTNVVSPGRVMKRSSPKRRQSSPRRQSASPARKQFIAKKTRARRVPLKKNKPIISDMASNEFLTHRWSAAEVLQMYPLYGRRTTEGFKRWLRGAVRQYGVNTTPKKITPTVHQKRLEFIAKVMSASEISQNCGRATVQLKDAKLADDIIAGEVVRPKTPRRRRK